MDQDSLRALATLLVFIAFIALCIRVYSRKNKDYYDEAAQLPFADENAKALSGNKRASENNAAHDKDIGSENGSRGR